MSIAVIFQVVLAALRFPSEMTAFIKLLQKTPEENRQDILTAVNAMITASQSSPDGRPAWDPGAK